MKNIIRLSETELRNIINESIKSVLNKGKNFIINETKSYKFRIDEISKITLKMIREHISYLKVIIGS